MAEDFEAVCKKFRVTSAIVLGWSLGGMWLRLEWPGAKSDGYFRAFFSDLVNFASSVDITGFINVAGPPYIDQDLFARVARPATLGILAALSQPPSVDVFQENALNLVHLFSEVISHDLFCTLLEGVIIQPRAVTAQVVSRKQDPTKLLQEGRDGKMEVLVVTGGKDSLVSAPGLRAVYEEMGWKKCTVKHLDEADHMPWVSRGDEFREIILGWIKGGRM
ncbi:hypothetical protein D9756_009078 [Leucocoprinus leucothites]|uniref:Uncharacterized protein n=1 Tax=Leucocoprinus leucothites TaxID=201217 RepID=A0A8H5CY75_9AGAR|nr:hypothetical protein D9756_009078 [Leucoagaricus leucothites]